MDGKLQHCLAIDILPLCATDKKAESPGLAPDAAPPGLPPVKRRPLDATASGGPDDSSLYGL